MVNTIQRQNFGGKPFLGSRVMRWAEENPVLDPDQFQLWMDEAREGVALQLPSSLVKGSGTHKSALGAWLGLDSRDKAGLSIGGRRWRGTVVCSLPHTPSAAPEPYESISAFFCPRAETIACPTLPSPPSWWPEKPRWGGGNKKSRYKGEGTLLTLVVQQ